MSDSHARTPNEGLPDLSHEGAHEGPIKTPKQLIAAVVASFLIPIAVIVLLVNFVAFGTKPGSGSDGLEPEAIARRLAPVGSIELRDLANPAALRTGEQVFQGQCAACHTSGAAGAPKVGDAAAWAPRIKTGLEALLTSALKGKGAMPPQGGGDFTDFEISRAVVFMANGAGGSLPEPKAPAAPGAAADGASAPAAGASAPAADSAASAPKS